MSTESGEFKQDVEDEKTSIESKIEEWNNTLQNESRELANRTRYLLSDKWGEDVSNLLRPEDSDDWSLEKRKAHFEIMAKFAVALPKISTSGTTAIFAEKIKNEAKKIWLESKDFKDDVIKYFIEISVLNIGMQMNTNTSGRVPIQETASRMTQVAKSFEQSDPEIHDTIVNPYRLEPGTEIYLLNQQGEITQFIISDVMLENGEGLVVIDDKFIEIDTVNQKLSSSEYMFKDGDNVFGGIEELEQFLAKFEPDSEIEIDISTPLDVDSTTKTAKVEILQSNVPELSKQYGKAFIPLAFSIYRNSSKSIVRVDIKISETGFVRKEVDIRTLRLVE